ncbi:conserved hypothetical protein [Ricinus communis]|uniref:Retrotransposon Copia-like N-terminal domain-containing protein n=1 Tax=Ricinus communis TaxID=3988 RepID=B9SFA2_RICCO|nr:conserved hypothetical protein [Ricinus communis]
MASASKESSLAGNPSTEGDDSTREKDNAMEKIINATEANKSFSSSENPLGSYCAIKLNHENYLLWKNMVLLVIKSNRMEYITGAKAPPPELLK